MTLSLENIAFERNFQCLFNKINSKLTSGECLQIQGDNGSGKSTLLRIIAGLLIPETGTVFWNEQPIHHHLNNYQNNLHYIAHQNGIKPNLTVKENLIFNSALMCDETLAAKIPSTLQKIDLFRLADKKAQYLSAGQARRLALARLILLPRTLWILDEPTTALDKNGQHLLNELLSQHLAHKGMVVLTTHTPLSNLAAKNLFLSAATTHA